MPLPTPDLLGKRVGRLTVVEKIGIVNKNVMWKCVCDCKNTITLSTRVINYGDTQSCGCLIRNKIKKDGSSFKSRKIDLLGNRYGLLKIISAVENAGGRSAWLCKCDCGKEIIVKTINLRSGDTNSCGCIKFLNNSKHHLWKGFGEISLFHWNRIKSVAAKRGYCFEITIEDGWDLFIKQKRKCALSGEFLVFKQSHNKGETTASLDRIDSNLGYTLDNIQWVHKDVNKMKWAISSERFLYLCNLVINKDNSEYKLVIPTVKHHKCWTGIGLLSSKKWATIKSGAKKRNIEFNISKQEMWELFVKQNGRCAITNLPIILGKENTASLDRIDSSKGYTLDNVWWVDVDINRIEFVFTMEKFIMLCGKIVENANI